MRFFYAFFLLIFSCYFVANATVSESQIRSTQQYVVSIKTRAVVAAYSQEGTSFGTGCIIDKKEGLILTNAHVVGGDKVVPYYEITLHDGRDVKAILVYTDPWHDFALLKVLSPKDIEALPAEMPIDNRMVKVGEAVYIVGKNENKHFSTQTGTIASPYEATNILPGQVFRISLNAQGGASGSPVCASNGKVIGLLHASNGVTSAFALPISYVVDALETIKKGQSPARYHVGVLLDYVSLDDLVRFYKLEAKFADSFRKRFPDAFNRALVVEDILVGSPAADVFQVGDIIVKVNNNEIGPDLYLFSKEMDALMAKNPEQSLTFTVIRLGKEQTVSVKPYDLHKKAIQRMVQFNGAVFYEADDFTLRRTGAKDYPVMVSTIRQSSSFYEKLPILPRSTTALVAIHKIDDTEIKSLDDLIRIIPELMKKEDFIIYYKNYAVEFGMDAVPMFAQTLRVQTISCSVHDGLPELFTRQKSGAWEMSHIGAPPSGVVAAQ